MRGHAVWVPWWRVLMMVVQAVGRSRLASLDHAVMRAIATVALGISGGCFGTLSTVTLPRFFGRTYLGAIAGVQMMCWAVRSSHRFWLRLRKFLGHTMWGCM